MYEIKNRWTGEVVYRSEKATSLREAVIEAVASAANLRAADLSAANLRDADLSDADLRDADLRDANLSAANLRDANLSAANLSAANLRAADLRAANLRDADLRDANLSAANLRAADLSAANLRDARNLPPVEPMPAIKEAILKEIEANPACLDMQQWHHDCNTVHCVAGWAVAKHPQGRLLESLIGPNAAGALIFQASVGEVPSFYSSNDQAIEWLRKPVAAQATVAGVAP